MAGGRYLRRPLLMAKVSKFARAGAAKSLGDSGLGEIDSVKKVSILIDIESRQGGPQTVFRGVACCSEATRDNSAVLI